MDLGREHDLVALDEILEGAADDLLRRAVGIDIGRVEEVDAEIEPLPDQRPARFLDQGPGMVAALRPALGHASDGMPRDFPAGPGAL